MDQQQSVTGANRPRLSLHVPEPRFRPGDHADFSYLELPPAGAQPRPDEMCPAAETFPLCDGLIRVLGDDGLACGPWDPKLAPDAVRETLRLMALTRA